MNSYRYKQDQGQENERRLYMVLASISENVKWAEGIKLNKKNLTCMATKIITINLELGMPTVEQANRRLTEELIRVRAQGAKVVKIIHGYGSSGVGGKLRLGIRATMTERKRRGQIKEAVPGENWSIFDEGSRRILDAYPDLSRDRDFERGNAGITILLL